MEGSLFCFFVLCFFDFFFNSPKAPLGVLMSWVRKKVLMSAKGLPNAQTLGTGRDFPVCSHNTTPELI